MKKNMARLVSLQGVCWAALLVAATPAGAADVAADGDVADEGATIVVTAQRREQKLLDVPVAVTALGEQALKDKQVNDVLDLENVVPGLKVSLFSTAPKITIRGVGSEAYNYGGDPGVAFHANGVYIGRPEAQRGAFFDLERVEVLRGPQGTLYGRNTTGGAINLIYRRPTQEFEAVLSGSYGNYDAYEASAVVNGGLSDTISARLGFKREYNKGYTRNAMPGGRRLDDQDNYTLRGQLLFEPTDRFELLLLGEYYHNGRRGPGRKFIGGPDGAPTAAELPPYNGKPLVPYDVRAVVSTLEPKEDMDFWSVTARARYAFEAFDLVSLSSYRDSRYGNRDDEGDGLDVDFSTLNINNDIWQFSQEVQLVSKPGALNWILGLYYFQEDGGFDRAIPFFKPNITLFNGGNVKTESYAAFGHFDYRLSPLVELFGGVRYSKDRKTMSEFLRFDGIPFAGNNTGRDSWGAVTWDAGVQFHVTPGSMIFAKASRGFKSGGFNTGALQTSSFDPEKVTSFEGGVKGAYLNGGVQFSLVGFYSNYRDMQLVQVVDFATSFNNAGRSTIKGVEFEGSVRPVRGLTFDLTMAYTDARLKEYMSQDAARPAKGLQNLAGNRLPNVPELKFNLGATYVADLSSAGKLRFNTSYYWEDRIYFDAFNEAQSSQGAVGRVDASITYVSPDQSLEVSLWGKNLTNELVRGYVSVLTAQIGSPHLLFWDPPRTYGVRVTKSF
ncbi:TonB-dependent receptor [Sphingomonas colocasiae]|uniref:TonB-dependent receptor n=1 Tax=Sphingomonas colocasiae TaxID=1848973 RepID=A0ABS7PQM5_9SPHN|nr:TonB-dependent receptor [Sphingomonas colocasiae]MBY8823573.1 TonB-dependent receptor [Sphingomonas colocasiae]